MNFIYNYIKAMGLLLISLLGLNACVANNANYGNGSSYNTYQPKPISTTDFSPERWHLEKINNESYRGRKITLNISIDNKVTGFSGCNRYFVSNIKVTGNQLNFGSVGSTRKLCVDTYSNNLESRYLASLRDITHFQRNNNRLVLDGRLGRLVFYKGGTR